MAKTLREELRAAILLKIKKKRTRLRAFTVMT